MLMRGQRNQRPVWQRRREEETGVKWKSDDRRGRQDGGSLGVKKLSAISATSTDANKQQDPGFGSPSFSSAVGSGAGGENGVEAWQIVGQDGHSSRKSACADGLFG